MQRADDQHSDKFMSTKVVDFNTRMSRLPTARQQWLTECLRQAESAEYLILRVHALPAEIFSAIYELTFAPIHEVVTVNEAFKWPAVAQVDRKSRRQFLDIYLKEYPFNFRDGRTCGQWLKAMRTDDRAAITEIQFDYGMEINTETFNTPHPRSQSRLLMHRKRRDAVNELAKFGVSLDEEQMYFQVDGVWGRNIFEIQEMKEYQQEFES